MKVIYKFWFIFDDLFQSFLMMSPFVVMGYTRTYNTQRSTSQSSTRLSRGKKNINERP